jgi:hypothetical protein
VIPLGRATTSYRVDIAPPSRGARVAALVARAGRRGDGWTRAPRQVIVRERSTRRALAAHAAPSSIAHAELVRTIYLDLARMTAPDFARRWIDRAAVTDLTERQSPPAPNLRQTARA